MSQTTSVTTLFLDVGGVLLTNGWDRQLRQKAADTFGLDYAEMDERHHLTFDTFEEGKLSFYEYLQRVVFYEERPFSLEEFKAYIFNASQAFSEMIDLVRQLKTQYALKIAVVSNEGRELSRFRTEKFHIAEFVDLFIVSCYAHVRKPDTDIFQTALDVTQVAKEQVLYIEDRTMFVEVAEKMGIRGIRHVSVTQTREALAGFGLTLT